MSRFQIEPPSTREEIDAGLRGLAAEIDRLVEEIDPAEFSAPQGDRWSPERHLRHLAKSVRAVVTGMVVPRLLLAFRFGRAKRPSRSFGEVVEIYRQALSNGATAGRFTPSERPPEVAPGEWRTRVAEEWVEASTSLSRALAGWTEKALDRYRLPHPLLGNMTVREILFFTLYHNAHHARRIVERRETEPG